MNELTIRPVKEADSEAIAGIYNYYVRETTVTFDEEPLTVARMRERVAGISRSWPYLVAEDAGEIIGYCYVHPWKEKIAYGRTLETTVYLRSGMTSRGVGRRLMETLIGECRSRGGIHSLIACITTENEGSRRFHASLGFEEVSHFREVGYKFGRYLDVTDMELLL